MIGFFYRWSVVIWLLILGSAAQTAAQSDPPPQRVSRADILRAMQMQEGYSLIATTNGARFKAAVILQLARWARDRDAEGASLLIGHEDMFAAYLDTARVTAEAAPTFMKLAHQHRQDYLIEYRKNRVLKAVIKGPAPDLALNVKEWWPDVAGLPDKYSYVDTLSKPNLAMTTQRVVTYRLLQFGDMVVYEEIQGLSGRPTSSVLGALLRLVGEAQASYSRMIVPGSGPVFARAQVKKAFLKVTRDVTIYPDGRTEEGLLGESQDLKAVENRLGTEMKIDYVPFGNF